MNAERGRALRAGELVDAAKRAALQEVRNQYDAVAGPPSEWGLAWAITHALHPLMFDRACEQVAQRLEQLRTEQGAVDPGLIPGLDAATRLARSLRTPAAREEAPLMHVAQAIAPAAEAFVTYEVDRGHDHEREWLADVMVDQARLVVDARVLDLLEPLLREERDEGQVNAEVERGLTRAIETVQTWRTYNTLNEAPNVHESTVTLTLTGGERDTLVTLLNDASERRESRREDIRHGDNYELSDVVGILANECRQDALCDRLGQELRPSKPLPPSDAPTVPGPGDLTTRTPASPGPGI